MIVSSMTNIEVSKALLADIDALQKKIPHLERECDRFVIKSKKFPFIKAFEYITPKTKNNWIIVIEKKSKKDTTYSIINYHYTKKGFRAAMVTPEREIVFLNDHLFIRYNVRDSLHLPENPVERVKDFFKKNPLFMIERTSSANNEINQIICKVNTGVILGLEVNSIMICNTYLSNEMLREDQLLISKALEDDMLTFMNKWNKKNKPFRKEY